jgi:hypothetical protein
VQLPNYWRGDWARATIVAIAQTFIKKVTMMIDVVRGALPKRRRGISIPDREVLTNEDEAILTALILLKKQMSPCRVAIHERVNLPVERVERLAAVLRAVGLLR